MARCYPSPVASVKYVDGKWPLLLADHRPATFAPGRLGIGTNICTLLVRRLFQKCPASLGWPSEPGAARGVAGRPVALSGDPAAFLVPSKGATMAQDASAAPAESKPAPSRRYRFLVIVDTVAILAIAAVWFLLPERFDRGTRSGMTFLIVVAAAIAAVFWFFALSRLSTKLRLLGALALVLIAAGLFASIRRVEFSGDMVPTFDFRWQPERYALLEAHRAQQRADETKTGAAGNAGKPAEPHPTEWDVLEYRGPNRDGVIPGPKLARDWSKQPPQLVWRQPVGGGYASFVVAGPMVVTIEQRRDNEAVVAYDIDTGRELWVHAYPALFSEPLGGDGPRATPTLHAGQVYSLGATGVLACLELATGKPHWSLNVLEENRVTNLDWGMAGSPLVYDEKVLVNPGNQNGSERSRSITTFGLDDGKLRHSGGQAKASYASPMLVTLGGVRQVLVFDGVGLAGFDAADCRELWRTPWKSDFDINAAQPIVLADDRVFISSAAGSAVYQIKQADGAWSAEQVWRTNRMKCGYACPIEHGGYIYGIDERLLACLDVTDGAIKWKARAGQFGHGQLLRRDDLLLVLGEAGELALVEANSAEYRELGRIQAIEGKTWNNPALIGRRILVRNHLEMAAYDLPLEE
jgi:outer membrane protein assembly factor BamB